MTKLYLFRLPNKWAVVAESEMIWRERPAIRDRRLDFVGFGRSCNQPLTMSLVTLRLTKTHVEHLCPQFCVLAAR